MNLPTQLLEQLAFTKGFNRQAFEAVHHSPQQVTSVRINPGKLKTQLNSPIGEPASPAVLEEKIPWTEYGYYLDRRPSFTFDPLFHAGCYYVQEASSMFLEQAVKQHTDLAKPLKILDLSAAPGGKSTHILSLINEESLLVSNEVIQSRARILKENIIKWGRSNVVVTNNDPRDFSRLENYFDIVVVDAPCSGSGLFRRDPTAIEEWNLNNVQLCSQRQQRILADVWPALRQGGLLVYSTCSYSEEENEALVSWMRSNLQAESLVLSIAASWGIIESEGYRFWPDKVRGEGFFLSCLRKTSGDEQSAIRPKKITGTDKKTLDILRQWTDEDDFFFRYENTIYAWPLYSVNDIGFILEKMKVLYSGTRVGELMRDKLVPDHALALRIQNKIDLPTVEVDYSTAIQYLQRKEISLDTTQKGWHLLNYRGHSLGWVNILASRINNYYPKELRILKEN